MLKDKSNDRQYDKLSIIVTGYVPFGFIKINPSDPLVKMIFNNKQEISNMFDGKITIDDFKVMKVSCQYVDDNITKIWSSLENVKNDREMKLVLSFGVDESIKRQIFNLETRGINSINDGISIKGPITSDLNLYSWINNKFDMQDIKNRLKTEQLSDDAGDYLCNYIYFKSLYHYIVKEHYYCQFIHIPNLDVLSTEDGFLKVLKYLRVLNDIYL